MYLLSKLNGSLIDLGSALKAKYPDGAMHAGSSIAYIVHRLHQTRQPECDMARQPWRVWGTAVLNSCCRCLAGLHQLAGHTGQAGLAYDVDWLRCLIHQVIRYVDHLMGPLGDAGVVAPVVIPPGADPAAVAARSLAEPGRLCDGYPPVPTPSRN